MVDPHRHRLKEFFGRADFSGYAQGSANEITGWLQSMTPDQVLSLPEEDLIETGVRLYSIDPPVLHFEALAIERKPQRFQYGEGMHIHIVIPVTGDTDVLDVLPQSHLLATFSGELQDGSLRLVQDVVPLPSEPEKAASAVRVAVDRAVEPWKQEMAYLHASVDEFNRNVPQRVREAVTLRRKEALRYKKVEEAIDIPLVANAPPLATIQVVSRPINLPEVKQPFRPEPRLDAKGFEEILARIRNMLRSMERDPAAYGALKEEHLRAQLLTVLNSNVTIAGMATGETFNVRGKTDILVRWQDHNIFVAECKIWSGPAAIAAALDQLLGYLSWRDTDAALLLFVKRDNFSRVMAEAVGAAEAHPGFKRNLPSPDNEARAKFRLPGDPTREVNVALVGAWLPKRK